MLKTFITGVAISIIVWLCSSSQKKELITHKKVKKMETKTNKQKVVALLKSIETGDSSSIAYINSNKYIQHNPNVGNGLEGLRKALEELAKARMPMKYTKNHKILGEGNFVLAVSEGVFLKKHVAFYDLLRIENDKIVEHWDTIEEIPESSQWKNTNGKF